MDNKHAHIHTREREANESLLLCRVLVVGQQKHVLDQRKPKQSWRTFYLTYKQQQQERLK